MTPDEPADVIGNLPRTRPSRRSPRRAPRVEAAEPVATSDATPSATPGTTPASATAKSPAPAKPVRKPAARPAAKAKAKPKTPVAAAKPKAVATGKVRGVTKTAPGRKVDERKRTTAQATSEAKAASSTPTTPIPPAGYAVPGAQRRGDGGLNLAEAIRGAAQLAEAGVGALRGLLGR